MRHEIIRDTERQWHEHPEKAVGKPTVKARTNGVNVELESGPFRWQTDLPAPLGGKNEAPSPTMALLGALAGCAAVFIQDTLAPQFGVKVESVEASVQCRSDARGLLALDGATPDLADMELQITVQSSDSEEKLRAMYDAWLARCPVYLAITKPMAVKTTFQLQRGAIAA